MSDYYTVHYKQFYQGVPDFPPTCHLHSQSNQPSQKIRLQKLIQKLATTTHFSSPDVIKQHILGIAPKLAGDSFGYIEPGHGLKGKLKLLTTDQDLVEMYSVYKTKREILLWCYVESGDPTKQRKQPAASTSFA